MSAIVDYQRRFDPGYEALVAKVHAGAIGNVSRLEAYWRQPNQVWLAKRTDLESKLGRRLTEMEFQLRNWVHFAWLAGDLSADPLSHNLDICNWIMRAPPDNSRATSARKQWTTNAYGDLSDFFSAEYTYPNGAVMAAETYRLKDHPGGVAEIAHGATGTAQFREFLISDRAGKPVWRYERDRVADNFQRGQDLFVESIRGGKSLNMVEDAANTALTGFMGQLSAALGRVVTRQETLASEEALFPDGQLTFDTLPPTMPDKFGDYQFPARGRGHMARPGITTESTAKDHVVDGPLAWTSTDGKTIQAEFLGLEGEVVVIRKGGNEFKIPLAKLSPESRKQAMERSRETKPTTE